MPYRAGGIRSWWLAPSELLTGQTLGKGFPPGFALMIAFGRRHSPRDLGLAQWSRATGDPAPGWEKLSRVSVKGSAGQAASPGRPAWGGSWCLLPQLAKNTS